jgi:hypothetical protein
MKLASVKYDSKNERWFGTEYLPDNPRSVLIYTPEGGTAEGKYENTEWIQYRWNCKVHPLFWRELPRYECKNSV